MKNQKKMISVILVFSMLFSNMLTIFASEYETYVKISDELLGELNVSYEDLLLGDFEDTGETYPCIIWIEDVKLDEAVEAGIDAAEQAIADDSSIAPYTYSYETTESSVATLVDVTLDDEASDEYVQTYIEAEREAAEEMYSDNNSQFVAENFMARDMSVTYVSKYSPCVFADLSVSKIAELVWESDYSEYDQYNEYNEVAYWMDHITYNHDVHIVNSAGNEGAKGVTSPAMAYNIVTVGNTRWSHGYTIGEDSSYNSEGISIAEQRTYKPDVVAPASCTSYAAAMVSGTIALMCELQPSLKTKQPIVKSILAASAGPNTVRFVTTDAKFAQYGAGMVDTWAALYIVAHGRFSPTTGVLSSTNTSQTYSMNVTANDSTMRVALAYTNYVNFANISNHSDMTIEPEIVKEYTIADLGISVYDPSGNLVITMPVNASTIGANLKVIHVPTNGKTGNFTIKVSLLTAPSGNRSTNFGVAWW